MSLTGNLEDLPLTDIIQIISLSKRTGILEVIEPSGNRGFILFKNGFVIGATSPNPSHMTLGEILIRQGLIEREVLQQILNEQLKTRPHVPLGQILVEKGLLDKKTLEEIIKHQIYRAIYEMLKIERGTFSFSLSEIIPVDHIRLDPLDLIFLEKGLSAQQVLLDALRTHDEESRTGEGHHESEFPDLNDLEATSKDLLEADSVEIEPVQDALTQPILERHVVFVISPYDTRSAIFNQIFSQYDLLTISIRTLEITHILDRIQEWQEKRFTIGLIIDVDAWVNNGVLPSFLETVVSKIIEKLPDISAFLCTTNDKLRHKTPGIQSLNSVIWLHGPQQGRQPLIIGYYAREIVHQLSKLHQKSTSHIEEKASFIEQLWKEVGLDEPYDIQTDAEFRFQRALQLLKNALGQLRDPQETPQISLLILQYASEFTDRGVLILITESGLIGLGGYGDTGDDEPMPLKVRRLRLKQLPLPFRKVIEDKTPFYGRKSDVQSLADFPDLIGRFTPGDFAIFPIIIKNEVVAVLYVDNAVSDASLGDLTYLEIFMNQAGVTLENALSHRKQDGVLFQ